MSSRIHILPEFIANQIAAGEVVQRPESVVKELVENAIDAGAECITVVLHGAGKNLIHVIDDGSGMSKEDLGLCLVRHATSKISTEQDLHRISTLGFRGEAMASIAAVADVEVRTRSRESDVGWTLTSQPGKPLALAPAANEFGTQILVRQLFSSVPGRRKFLKSDLTEFRYVSETMQTLALSRPSLRFVFYDGPTRIFDLPPSDLPSRFGRVLSLDAERSLLEVSASASGITLHGYVGRPDAVRQSRSAQFLFLNGRPIKSRALAHAVNQAYEHLIGPREFPVFALFLDVDPERVDVNVHPQKHEVKFDDERSVFLLLQDSVMRALSQASFIPPVMSNVSIASHPLTSLPSSPVGDNLVVNRLTGEILPQRGPLPERGMPGPTEPRFTAAHRQGYDALFAPRDEPEEHRQLIYATSERIICVLPAGITVVRPVAAAERIFFEQIMAQSNGSVMPQTLLFPVEIPVDASRSALLKEHAELIVSAGFAIDIHEGILTVSAVPSMIAPGEESSVIDELVAAMTEVETAPVLSRRESIVARLARQYARRSVEGMTIERAEMMVRQLRQCNIMHHTPFGIPTFTMISFEELDRRLS